MVYFFTGTGSGRRKAKSSMRGARTMQKVAHGAENGALGAEKTEKERRSAEGGAWHKNKVRCERRRGMIRLCPHLTLLVSGARRKQGAKQAKALPFAHSDRDAQGRSKAKSSTRERYIRDRCRAGVCKGQNGRARQEVGRRQAESRDGSGIGETSCILRENMV